MVTLLLKSEEDHLGRDYTAAESFALAIAVTDMHLPLTWTSSLLVKNSLCALDTRYAIAFLSKPAKLLHFISILEDLSRRKILVTAVMSPNNYLLYRHY